MPLNFAIGPLEETAPINGIRVLVGDTTDGVPGIQLELKRDNNTSIFVLDNPQVFRWVTAAIVEANDWLVSQQIDTLQAEIQRLKNLPGRDVGVAP